MSIPQTLNSEESGLKGEAGPSHLPQEETVPRGTISPRVKINRIAETAGPLLAYQDPSHPTVRRILINNDLNDIPFGSCPNDYTSSREKDVFKRAVKWLDKIDAAEKVLAEKPTPPRCIKESNALLVDFFEFKDGKFISESAIHTLCVWKKTETDLIVIDPSNSKFAQRLIKPIGDYIKNDLAESYTLCLKRHDPLFLQKKRLELIDERKADDKFYQRSEEDDMSSAGEGNSVNKNNRDCIDIALKIAFSLQVSLKLEFDINSIENNINYLSNIQAVNGNLLRGGAEENIGWLQSSNPQERDQAIRLLLENKDYITFIEDVKDIEALRKLNSARLKIIESGGSDYTTGQIQECFKTFFEKKQNKMPLDMFVLSSGVFAESLRLDKLRNAAKGSHQSKSTKGQKK